MLRVTTAKWLALGTAATVVLGAATFAWLRNAPTASDARSAELPSAATSAEAERAGAAFERLGCAMCHALEGRGNPKSPLDRAAARRDRSAIRDWTVGSGAAREQLPPAVAERKSRAADDPELDALVDYVATPR